MLFRSALELSRQRSAQMAAVEMGGKTSNSSAECRDNRCMESRLVHEMDTAAEGVVSAFNGQKEDFGGDFWGKPNTGGQISTGTLTRPITPSSCFKEVKECKVVPCQGFVKGKRCRSGETQQVCTSKQIPVRCEGGSSR